MSREWWSANDSFLSPLFEKFYKDSRTDGVYEFDKVCNVYEAMSCDDEVKKRGITRNEIAIWETVKRFGKVPHIVQVSC